MKVSSLKINTAEYLPTYLRVNDSPVFLNVRELDEYLIKNGRYGGFFAKEVSEFRSRTYKHFDY